MREIKFRAWDKYNKVLLTPDNKDFQNNFKLYPAGNYSYKGEYADGWLEIMQYTGRKDKKGNEIYEGDIVGFKERKSTKYWDVTSYVSFDEGILMPFVDLVWVGDTYEYFMKNYSYYEVIGNIYENPELLEGIHEKN